MENEADPMWESLEARPFPRSPAELGLPLLQAKSLQKQLPQAFFLKAVISTE